MELLARALLELLARALLELLARVFRRAVLGVERLARVVLFTVLGVELLARVLLRVVLGVELLARVLFFTVLRVKLLARVREAVVRVDSLPLGAGLLLLAAEPWLEAETVLSDARDCEATAPSPSTTSPSTSPRSTAGHLEVACLVAARAWAFIAASFLVPGLSGTQGVLEGREGGPGRPNPH